MSSFLNRYSQPDQYRNKQRENRVSFYHCGIDDTFNHLIGSLSCKLKCSSCCLSLGNTGPNADCSDWNACAHEIESLGCSEVNHVSAEQTDFYHDQECDNQTVNTLRARECLQNDCFTEFFRVFRNNAGSRLTSDAYAHSGADACQRMAFALSAYNGGIGWVGRDRKEAERQGRDPARWFGQVEKVNAGRSASSLRENRRYVRLILLERQYWYRKAGWGPGIGCGGGHD